MSDPTAATNQFGHSVNPAMVTLAREARGLSMSELATQIGVALARLSRLEGGLSPVDDESLKRLSFALKFPVGFFFQTDTLYGPSVSEFYHYR